VKGFGHNAESVLKCCYIFVFHFEALLANKVRTAASKKNKNI
jgi:hypothetical protein